MSEGGNPPLPDLHQGSLTPAEVRALARDIATLGEQLEVLPKGGPRAYTAPAGGELAPAVEALLSGELYGLQLRYVHDGEGWSDTLLPRGERFHLVRMKHSLA